jgi:hypothetical protein
MIITDNHMKYKTLDTIAESKDCTYYRILSTGELLINNLFKSYVYLAYVRGNWFASFGTRKGASVAIPENGLDLFAYGNNSLWIQTSDNDVDLSTPVIPLDQNTRVMLFAFSGKAYDLVIADGSKYRTTISTWVKKTTDNTAFLIMALTAMIRQYDEQSADEILKFWFQPKSSSSSEKGYHQQIQFEKKSTVQEKQNNLPSAPQEEH